MTRICLTVTLTMTSTTAFAGVPMPVPGPTLGVAGPWGLAIGVAGYGAYKLFRHLKDR